MRYFATADDQEIASKKKKEHGAMTEVEKQILGMLGGVLDQRVVDNKASHFCYSHQSYHGSLWQRKDYTQ